MPGILRGRCPLVPPLVHKRNFGRGEPAAFTYCLGKASSNKIERPKALNLLMVNLTFYRKNTRIIFYVIEQFFRDFYGLISDVQNESYLVIV